MKKIFTLIALALGVIAIYSCEGDDPSPKPPVIIKPDPPKEPVLTITQAPEGQIAWGQSAKITITSENAKFFWKGDSVTSTTFELKYLLKDTTFSIEAKGYKSISKSHTINVSTPTEYEKLIVGAWQIVAMKGYDPIDDYDRSKGYYWTEWEFFETDCQVENNFSTLEHYSVNKKIKYVLPCLGVVNGNAPNYIPYIIRTDSVGRPTLESSGNILRDPLLINYPEVIVKLTKDTLIILKEIKPAVLLTTHYLTHMRMYVRVSDKPYAFSEEEGGIGAGSRLKATSQKLPSYQYVKGKGLVRE
jgi:hypothetical protein